MNKGNGWELIGHVGIDAGLCWIGDPCYILHKDKPSASIGKDWDEFCNLLGDSYPTKKSFPYDLGHEGLGVCVSTGYGDGFYPVYGKKQDGRIMELYINFGEEDQEDYDEI